MRKGTTQTTINGFPALLLDDGRLIQIPGGGVGDDDDAGGTGDAGLTDADATATAAEPLTDSTRAADDKGVEPGPVPYQRFKEVNDTNRAYGKLGKPDELNARLAKLDDYERREQAATEAERHRQDAEARKANPKLADAEDLVVDIIRRKFPGVAEVADRQADTERLAIERHVQHGFEHIPALLKEHGISVTSETVDAYETLVESQLLKDATLKAKFWKPATQAEAVQEAFTRTKARILNPALQAAGAKTMDDARSRATRTLGRAAPSGTAKAEPRKFASKHQPGTSAHQADRDTYTRQMIADALDAESGEEAAAL